MTRVLLLIVKEYGGWAYIWSCFWNLVGYGLGGIPQKFCLYSLLFSFIAFMDHRRLDGGYHGVIVLARHALQASSISCVYSFSCYTSNRGQRPIFSF